MYGLYAAIYSTSIISSKRKERKERKGRKDFTNFRVPQ